MSQAFEIFQSTLVYTHTGSARQILDDLRQIQTLDKQSEKSAFKFGCLGAAMVPAALLGAPLGMVTQPALGIVWAVGCLGAAVALLLKARAAKQTDVEDRRYEMAHALVNLLSRDMAPDASLQLRLSLRRPDRKENFQKKGKVGRWNYELFHDDWLDLQSRLLDGTVCRVQLQDRRQNRHRVSRSASGKTKHKRKQKSALEAVVRLKPKPDRYRKLDEIGAQARGAVQLPAWAQLKGLSVEQRALVMKAGAKTPWGTVASEVLGESKKRGPHGVHLLAAMLLSMYQILNLSRAVTKAQRNSQ